MTAGVLMDSFDIAQWADKYGKDNAGKKLFPDGQLQVISKYDTPSTCIQLLHRTLCTMLQAHDSTYGIITRCSSVLVSKETGMIVTLL